MDEAKPKTGQPDQQQPEQSGATESEKGDFTLEELLRAHQRNLDGERPVAWPTPRRDK